MPEGPSIVILKEETKKFKGKKALAVFGNAKADLQRAKGLKITDLKTWGKHFLICFDGFYFRIHLLMFGSYRIDEKKDVAPRLSLQFATGELNFYNCSVKLENGNANEHYDWQADVMNENWNPKKAESKLKELKKVKVCDALLDQDIFSGVGNIIKNEVLFRLKVHPDSYINALPLKKLKELIKEARDYSFDFYVWKKKFELRKHWQIYRQKNCPRCKIKTVTAYMGKRNRLTCYCDNCQQLYVKPRAK